LNGSSDKDWVRIDFSSRSEHWIISFTCIWFLSSINSSVIRRYICRGETVNCNILFIWYCKHRAYIPLAFKKGWVFFKKKTDFCQTLTWAFFQYMYIEKDHTNVSQCKVKIMRIILHEYKTISGDVDCINSNAIEISSYTN